MKVLVVYCHPSQQSFTHQVYDQFCRGLTDAGHEIITSELYEMAFLTDMSESEYLRETYYRADLPLPADVMAEQEKIRHCDGIAFVYPVFWTEAPAKLVGWFDRVWTTGFAYSPEPAMKTLRKALCIACAGKTMQSLEETGERQAMETVMLGDRIRDRAQTRSMVIFDRITHWDEAVREEAAALHLQEAYRLGLNF